MRLQIAGRVRVSGDLGNKAMMSAGDGAKLPERKTEKGGYFVNYLWGEYRALKLGTWLVDAGE